MNKLVLFWTLLDANIGDQLDCTCCFGDA